MGNTRIKYNVETSPAPPSAFYLCTWRHRTWPEKQSGGEAERPYTLYSVLCTFGTWRHRGGEAERLPLRREEAHNVANLPGEALIEQAAYSVLCTLYFLLCT